MKNDADELFPDEPQKENQQALDQDGEMDRDLARWDNEGGAIRELHPDYIKWIAPRVQPKVTSRTAPAP